MRKLSILAIALATAFSGMGPVEAAPIFVPSKSAVMQTDAQGVQAKRIWRRGHQVRRGVHRPSRVRPGWHNGHRGYRHARPGYRRYSDGWWYPLAAFGAGAIIGGAIASTPSTSHVQWCANRYRTYRASDNTYVPRVGVRAYCNSPYN